MAYYLSFVRALDPNVYRAPGAARWEEIGGGGAGVDGGYGGGGAAGSYGGEEDKMGEGVVDVDISAGKTDDESSNSSRKDLMTRRRRRAVVKSAEVRKERKTPGRAKRLVIRTEGSTMEETDQGEWERCGFWSGLAGGTMRQR